MKRVLRIFEDVRRSRRKVLLEHEANVVCAEYGITIAKGGFARNLHEALRVAEEIGYPVVLKAVSPDIIHKSDVGGVLLNLNDAEDLREAYERMMLNLRERKCDAKVLGVFVQEMVPSSVEVIIGMVRDSAFGPVLMFGLGGILVELLKDVSFRVAPVSRRDAAEMISEVRAYPILKGYRGNPPLDVDAIIEILLRTSRLVMDYMEIVELDLNPVIVYNKGAKVIDARICLADPEGLQESPKTNP